MSAVLISTSVILPLLILLGAAAALLLRRNLRGTISYGLVMLLGRVHTRLLHRLRVEGKDHLRDLDLNNGLIVVSNHTAGVDPILIQMALPFEVRWMMAADMAFPVLGRLWRYFRIIEVDRYGGDRRSLREALRHLGDDGVLGIFPEGFLERPPRQVRVFHPGVGLLIARSKAAVLPVIVEGTPQVDPAWGSIFRFSHSTVRILPPLTRDDLLAEGRDAAAITGKLQQCYLKATGWPLNESDPPERGPIGRRTVLIAFIGKRLD